ncbi:unnamed protein product [Eruca vesicaria subsp. sativa]|uniref:EF-hand domain-containing protein n=1 Tax=Eruca vesicaria subsp. sativa TaxID=29727 RepID=A0ABC8JM58_ERUVS|nr:unnamed protein product [Eruca vesicaria subsp. sativa]
MKHSYYVHAISFHAFMICHASIFSLALEAVSNSSLKFTHVLYNLSPAELCEQAIKCDRLRLRLLPPEISIISFVKIFHTITRNRKMGSSHLSESDAEEELKEIFEFVDKDQNGYTVPLRSLKSIFTAITGRDPGAAKKI